MGALFKCKANNLVPKPPTTFVWSSHTQGHYPIVLITPQPGPRWLGTSHKPLSSSKLFKLSNPHPTNLPCPFFSLGTHNKDSCPHFLLSLCLLMNPSSSLHAPPSHGLLCSPLLGSVSITKYLFKHNCLLICWPNYT